MKGFLRFCFVYRSTTTSTSFWSLSNNEKFFFAGAVLCPSSIIILIQLYITLTYYLFIIFFFCCLVGHRCLLYLSYHVVYRVAAKYIARRPPPHTITRTHTRSRGQGLFIFIINFITNIGSRRKKFLHSFSAPSPFFINS